MKPSDKKPGLGPTTFRINRRDFMKASALAATSAAAGVALSPDLAEAANRKDMWVAGTALGVSVAMLGAAYAAVPLYRIFCQVTGFGGTTQRLLDAPERPALALAR